MCTELLLKVNPTLFPSTSTTTNFVVVLSNESHLTKCTSTSTNGSINCLLRFIRVHAAVEKIIINYITVPCIRPSATVIASHIANQFPLISWEIHDGSGDYAKRLQSFCTFFFIFRFNSIRNKVLNAWLIFDLHRRTSATKSVPSSYFWFSAGRDAPLETIFTERKEKDEKKMPQFDWQPTPAMHLLICPICVVDLCRTKYACDQMRFLLNCFFTSPHKRTEE